MSRAARKPVLGVPGYAVLHGHLLVAYAIRTYDFACVNVPPTAKVIRRKGHGLKSRPTDWKSRGSNLLRPLVYETSGLSPTPRTVASIIYTVCTILHELDQHLLFSLKREGHSKYQQVSFLC